FIYVTVVCALIAILGVGSGMAADKHPKATLVYEHALPNVPGKSIKAVLVEYGPGDASSAHTHPKSAFIYATVLEGAIRTSVNDGPIVIYRAGQNFSEVPGDRHSVDENASKTEPARRYCWHLNKLRSSLHSSWSRLRPANTKAAYVRTGWHRHGGSRDGKHVGRNVAQALRLVTQPASLPIHAISWASNQTNQC